MNEALKTAKGKLLMIAIVLATVLVALAATSKPAAAYTHTSAGRPGSVEVYRIQGSHYNGCQSMGYACWVPWVTGAGPVVYRSPATTGTQTITVAYQLQKWNNGSWVVYGNNKIYTRHLQAGYSWIRMDRPDFLPNSGGYFRVATAISWGNYSTGQFLGSRTLEFNQSGDYMCNTQFTSSCSSSDWVYLKSPGQ